MVEKKALMSWTVEDSAELYGIRNWGAGYFDVSSNGEVVVRSSGSQGAIAIGIPEIIRGMRERGLDMPVLLRIENILDAQIARLHTSFRKAIQTLGYLGEYRGVFPIKVNQQQQVVEKIANFGACFHHGLEVGSKAELIAAIAQLRDKEACLICNGYKDAEFIDLGLHITKMGFHCFFVVEMDSEIDLIIERSRLAGVRPYIGARSKLSARASGHWADSGGERSTFGLTASQLVDMVDKLKTENMLDCFRLLHYHLGSQLPNIRDIRGAAMEASRIYVSLVHEGAAMGYLDLGGGLAVDYDGSKTNFIGSCNYSLDEYTLDIVEAVMEILNEQNVEHPHIITESGRATVAYSSVLLFNVLEVSKVEVGHLPESIPEDLPDPILNMREVYDGLTLKNLQESYNDAIYYRDEVRQMFLHGRVDIRQRTIAERFFWMIIKQIARMREGLERIPKDFDEIDLALADIYYGNFSVFQSLPDSWAIKQLFPVMPVHRLGEIPSRQAILSDITCDSDGRIDRFIHPQGIRRTLDLHPLVPGEEYYLGVFLVGAYQETLGDLHNLLGDTNIVSIRINDDGAYEFVKEIPGDTVAAILSYVEYSPSHIIEDLRMLAECAVRERRITPSERYDIMQAFENGLRGYAYFER